MGTFTDWADLVHGPDARVGQPDVRLPPELRRRHGRDDRQGNQGSGAGDRVPERRAAGQGRGGGERRRPRPVPVGGRHGAGADAQLRPVQGADALHAHRPAEEVRQDVRRHQNADKDYGNVEATAPGPTSRSAAPTAGTSCSSPACGSRISSTTTSAAPRCASSRTPRSRARSRFCAYNTGIGWRQHHREDAHDGDAHQVVRGARPSRDLRRQQGRAAADHGALAGAERRGGGQGRADGPRRPRHRQERARREGQGDGATPRWRGCIASTC